MSLNRPCHPIDELLVDYTDGELSAGDAAQVEAHLVSCGNCREELRLLRKSLGLARVVWEESAAGVPSPQKRRVQPRRRRVPLPLAAGLAACAVVLVILFGLQLLLPDGTRQRAGQPDQANPDRKTADNHGPVATPRAGNGGPNTPQDVDVERLIAREGRAARLAASARLLATQPGLESYQGRAERYLAEAYRGTAAAEAVPLDVHTPIKEPRS